MDTKIKIIRAAVVSNLIIFGLAACSSTPAPWTQQSDSPWGAKHAAESASVLPDESVTAVDSDEPVMLDESAPMAESSAMQEPISMQEPMVEPVPVVVAPVVVAEVETLTPEEEVLAMPASNYAIQVYASKTIESIDKFKTNNDLNSLMTVATDRSGSVVYVLIDVYPDKSTANAAAVDLEAKTGSKPWVRSIGGLQKIVAQ